jgi:hypothetical protein
MKFINILPHVPVIGFLVMALSDKVFCQQTTANIVLSSVLQAAFICTTFLGVIP